MSIRRRLALWLCPDLKPRGWAMLPPDGWGCSFEGVQNAAHQVVVGRDCSGVGTEADHPVAAIGNGLLIDGAVQAVAENKRADQRGVSGDEGEEPRIGGMGHKILHGLSGDADGSRVPASAPVIGEPVQERTPDQRHALITLAETLAAHQGVTHFAISMRALRKGDFFKKMKDQGADCRTRTAAKLMAWFDANWPRDLAWPRDIPRPTPNKQKKEAA